MATALTLVVGPLAAQQGPSWVGIQGGYDWQNNSDRLVKDNTIFGITGGHWFTDHWGADLSLLGTQLQGKGSGIKADEYHLHLSGLYNFVPGGTWLPYLRAGVGATQVDTPWSFSTGTTTRLSYHAGVGIQGRLTDQFLLGLEARQIRIETRKSYDETVALVTLGYRFGGAPKPAPKVEPPPPPPPPPPAPRVEPPPPPPPPAPKVERPAPPPPAKIVLDEAVLHFANDKHQLPPEGVAAVRKVAESLKTFKGAYNLTVTGYTSSVGSLAHNKTLSLRRAQAVAKVLEESGIPKGSITAVGRGPESPISENKTKEGQAKNRRVEIDVRTSEQNVEIRKQTTPLDGA